MSWLGKILGGGLGFVIGGPIGAVLGVALGHTIDSKGAAFLTGLEQKQSIYFTAVFSMLGKIAKADGQVSQYEIYMIDKVMADNFRLSPDARKLAINIFNAAKDSPEPFESFARQLHDEFSDAPEVLVSVVDLLMVVAHVDGEFHPAEQQMIEAAVSIFGIEEQFSQIRSRFGGVPDDIERYYEILGCKRGDDAATVKKQYRKLAMEYHPDRIQSKGMAPEFADAAEEKFKEIQHAWDMVEKDLS